jgi:hypothetical protein
MREPEGRLHVNRPAALQDPGSASEQFMKNP